MILDNFLLILSNSPELIDFDDTMAVIEELYEFTPMRFTNGGLVNEAGENSGSCKLFAFATLQNLTAEQTLACFGTYYRDDVLGNPEGSDHQNIRHFMEHGLAGIEFDDTALVLKSA